MSRALIHIRRLYTCAAPGSATPPLLEDAAIVWTGDRITWLGPTADLPAEHRKWAIHWSGQSGFLMPALVDCHTHLVFGGWRAHEFAQRCRGATYQEIAAAGGGIASTMRATRAASADELYGLALERLRQMVALGVGTVECKSGYGLALADELKLLRVQRRLAESTRLRLVSTFLGAHVVPPEYRSERERYVALVCAEMLPQIAAEGLAQFCDVFVEEGAFSQDEARRVLTMAQRLGLRPKLHVDQLQDGGGAALAAELGAISADHLEHTGAAGIEALARAGVIAVTLPLATLYLRQPPLDARTFLAAGVPVAVATDFNPGTAPSWNLPLAMGLACIMNRLTPEQALAGATRIAAQAIGVADEVGSLEVGKRMDAMWVEAPDIDHWLYRLGDPRPTCGWIAGQPHLQAVPPAPPLSSLPASPS